MLEVWYNTGPLKDIIALAEICHYDVLEVIKYSVPGCRSF
jgi:hypothetical protein